MGTRHYLALGTEEERERGISELSRGIREASLDGSPLSIKFPKSFPVPGYSGEDVPDGKNFASFQHIPSGRRTRSDNLLHRSPSEQTDRPEGFDLYFTIFGPEDGFNERDSPILGAFSEGELSEIYRHALSGENSRMSAESHDTSLGRTFYLRRCVDCPYPAEPQIVGTMSVSKRSLKGADLIAHASFGSRIRVSPRHPCSTPEGTPYDFSGVISRLVYGFAEKVAEKQVALYGQS